MSPVWTPTTWQSSDRNKPVVVCVRLESELRNIQPANTFMFTRIFPPNTIRKSLVLQDRSIKVQLLLLQRGRLCDNLSPTKTEKPIPSLILGHIRTPNKEPRRVVG